MARPLAAAGLPSQSWRSTTRVWPQTMPSPSILGAIVTTRRQQLLRCCDGLGLGDTTRALPSAADGYGHHPGLGTANPGSGNYINAHGRARCRGPAETVLDGSEATSSLVCAPNAVLDARYAKALAAPSQDDSQLARPYARLSALRLRASCGPAVEHLLRKSILPFLEELTLFSYYDNEEEEKPGAAPNLDAGTELDDGSNSSAAVRTPPDFFQFPRLRELCIDEGGTRQGSGRPWGEWAAFRHLCALESLTWIGDYQCGLRGDIGDALPALSGLRRLSLHSTTHSPQGLAHLKYLESLSATISSTHGDCLGAWDLRGLCSLREAVFQGRCSSGLERLPLMDASLTALERLCLVDVQVSLRSSKPVPGAGGGGKARPAHPRPEQEQLQAMPGTTATEAAVVGTVGHLDGVCALFEAWVAPCCGVLPNLRTVEVWYPLFTAGGHEYTGQLRLDPRMGSWVQAADGTRWRARVWRYTGEGQYGELTEPHVLQVVSGVPVEVREGATPRQLWLKLAFERASETE